MPRNTSIENDDQGGERVRELELAALRLRLPLLDPDRHALDLDADQRFARLALEGPEASTGAPRTPEPAD